MADENGHTIRSLFTYDSAARHASQSAKLRSPANFPCGAQAAAFRPFAIDYRELGRRSSTDEDGKIEADVDLGA
jgi:hypothetical protein